MKAAPFRERSRFGRVLLAALLIVPLISSLACGSGGGDDGGGVGPQADADADGVPDAIDNCVGAPNATQADTDLDSRGDACDPCPTDSTDSCNWQSTDLVLSVGTGQGIAGLSVVVSASPSIAVTEIAGIGPFLGALCDTSIRVGQAEGTCALATTFDAPASVFRLSVAHAAHESPSGLTAVVTCEAADEIGNVFAVTCSLN